MFGLVLLGLSSLLLSSQLVGGETPYCEESDVDAPNTKELFSLLMVNYSNICRPKMATNDTYGLVDAPEYVEFEFLVSNLWSIKSITTTFEYTGELWLQWVDCRLAFKSPERGGHVPVISMSHEALLMAFDNDLIWTPLPRNKNAAKEALALNNAIIWYIEPSGVVRARVPQRGTGRCPMDFAGVPFDDHTCKFIYASPEFLETEVQYVLATNPAHYVATGGLKNADWEIGPLEAVQTTTQTSLSDDEWLTYSAVEASFRIERNSYYYIANAVLPTLLFYLLSYVGFYISITAAPSRSAIHMSSILILVNHLRNITETLPTVSYRTWLGDYIVAHLCITVFHMVSFAIVFYCNDRLVYFTKRKEVQKLALEQALSAQALEQSRKAAEDGVMKARGALRRLDARIYMLKFGASFDAIFRVASVLLVIALNIYFLGFRED